MAIIHLHFDPLSRLLGAFLNIKLINQPGVNFYFLSKMIWVADSALWYILAAPTPEICLD